MDNLFKMVKIPDVKIEPFSNPISVDGRLDLDLDCTPITSLGNLKKVEGELKLEDLRKED